MKKFLLPVVASVLFLSSPGTGEERPVEIPERSRFHLFVLAGQSNMAGRGKVTGEDTKPHPRVLMLSKDLAWVPAVHPMHFDKPVAGVGLGRSFALELAREDPEVVIGLIPCAVGGSPVESWEPGGFHEQTGTHPWDDMVPRVRTAMRSGTLQGILWHQGESDAKEERAPLYADRLEALVIRFRKTFDAPDIPFIAGQMGNWPERPWNEWKRMVDAAHRNLPKSLPHTGFVSAEGLSHRDGVHFDRDSYITLGRRYAAAYRELRDAED